MAATWKRSVTLLTMKLAMPVFRASGPPKYTAEPFHLLQSPSLEIPVCQMQQKTTEGRRLKPQQTRCPKNARIRYYKPTLEATYSGTQFLA